MVSPLRVPNHDPWLITQVIFRHPTTTTEVRWERPARSCYLIRLAGWGLDFFWSCFLLGV